MCQVFHDVEFRIVGQRLLGRVDGDHAVLGPAPGAAPAGWQYHVPVDEAIRTVAQVVPSVRFFSSSKFSHCTSSRVSVISRAWREVRVSSCVRGPMRAKVGKGWQSTEARAIVLADTPFCFPNALARASRSKFPVLYQTRTISASE